MINAVGRDIPEEVLAATGKKVFEGAYAYDNYEYKKAAPTVRAMVDPNRSKMVSSIREALEKCGIRDGMVLSFHHHFREGDYVVKLGLNDEKGSLMRLELMAPDQPQAIRLSRSFRKNAELIYHLIMADLLDETDFGE